MSHASAKRQELMRLRAALVAHLSEQDDPCCDRGVSWPCDVACALLDADELRQGKRWRHGAADENWLKELRA